MRNLKKVLSLALALVMLLGMMVVGAGAATSFKDDDKIQNKEAVAVLVGMGIMKGREDGSNFEPAGTLTRAEAAKMIAQLDLGVDAADALKGNGTSPFSDVWSGYWAEGAIDYCVEQGYINGDGAGHFFPGNKVSSVEFGIMLLRLLGYDAKNEGLVGDQWATKGAALARKAGLTTSVAANTEPMTRDAMAQMAFNALTATLVEYNGLNIDSPNLVINTPASPRYHDANDIGKGLTYDGKTPTATTTIKFCEEHFPDLGLVTGSRDGFEREYSVWTWKKVDIANSKVLVKADAEFTAKTSTSTVSSAINGARGGDLYVNGKPYSDAEINKLVDKKTNGIVDSAVINALSANGRQVLVYLRDNDHTAIKKVVVVDTFVGEITAVKGGSTPSVTVSPKFNQTVEKDASKLVKSFETSDFENGDIVAYTAAYNSDGKYDIKSVKALEVAQTGALAKWNGNNFADNNSSAGQSNFTVDGTEYKYSAFNVVESDSNAIYELKIKQDVNVYVDGYGYALYIVPVTIENSYAAVIGVGSTNAFGSETNGCTLLFPDGTIKAVTYKMDKNSPALSKDGDDAQTVKDAIGDVVSYTVDDDEVYTLTLKDGNAKYDNTPATSDGFTNTNKTSFTNGKSAMWLDGNKWYTTSKTVFFVATGSGDNLSYTAYTGYATMPSFTTTGDNQGITGYAVTLNSKYTSQIDAVYISTKGLQGAAGVDTYFVKPERAPTATDGTGTYYILNAIVKGEETTVMVRQDAYTGFKAATGVFAATNVIKDKNDIITSFTLANDTVFTASKGSRNAPGTITTTNTVTQTQRDPSERAVLGIGGDEKTATFWAYGSETKVYLVDDEYKTISISNMASIQDDPNDKVFAAADSGTKVLTNVIIVEIDNDENTDDPGEATVPAGVTYAIAGADTPLSSTKTLKIGYMNDADEPTTLAELNAIVAKWAKENSLTVEATPTVSGTTYTWKCLNSFGASPCNIQVDTGSDIIKGLRVQFVNEKGESTGNGYEILGASTDAATSGTKMAYNLIGNSLFIKNHNATNGYYTAYRASGSADWSYSDVKATNDTAIADATANTKEGAVEIKANDYQIWLTEKDAKVKIDNDTYVGTAGTTKVNDAGYKPDAAGTFVKDDTLNASGAVTSTAFTAPASTTFTDGHAYTTGYVKVTKDTTNISKVEVGGATAPTATADADTYYVPVNSTITVTFKAAADGKPFRISDADTTYGSAFDVVNTTALVMPATKIGAKDVTVGEVQKITLPATVSGTPAGSSLSVKWYIDGEEVSSGDNYCGKAATNKIVAKVKFGTAFTPADADDNIKGGAGSTATGDTTYASYATTTATLKQVEIPTTAEFTFTWLGNGTNTYTVTYADS